MTNPPPSIPIFESFGRLIRFGIIDTDIDIGIGFLSGGWVYVTSNDNHGPSLDTRIVYIMQLISVPFFLLQFMYRGLLFAKRRFPRSRHDRLSGVDSTLDGRDYHPHSVHSHADDSEEVSPLSPMFVSLKFSHVVPLRLLTIIQENHSNNVSRPPHPSDLFLHPT
jgi:hypothetical protein